LIGAGVAGAQGFTGLGQLPAHFSTYSNSMSDDGSVVVGFAGSASSDHAFRWTRGVGGGVLQDLGTLPGGQIAYANGLTRDGAMAVGWSDHLGVFHAVTWTAGGAAQALPWPEVDSGAQAASPDGSVVVGFGVEAFDRSVAVAWVRAGNSWTAQDLGRLAGDTAAGATGVSGDASIIVGNSFSDLSHAFRWTAARGMAPLAPVTPGDETGVWAVSRDGSVIVGMSGYVAVRWIGAGQPVSLGALPGDSQSDALGVSADGAAIVGWSLSPGGPRHAYLWTSARGMLDLNTYLPSLGLDISGWTLVSATCVSSDGLAIAGDGDHAGATEAWVAVLPRCGSADFDGDGDVGTDADIEAFFACLAGNCCAACGSADFNGDGDVGADADIEAFFRVLAGGAC
jgi:probable HAF family extracellular repeat protein